ncbi:MAG: D-alanine--D-alanine ligase family protein [Christensenellales bacterium]|jgi:D-alanine-D-alanine ligase
MKTDVAFVFGGRTCEHDVSIISGIQALGAANTETYNAFPVYIDGDGAWYIGDALRNIDFYTKFDAKQVKRVLPFGEGGKLLLMEYPEERAKLFSKGRAILATADVAFLVMHGMNGEDGTLQGLLEMYCVPYTSSGVLGSAVGMDKIVMKQVYRSCGLPVLPDVWFTRAEWKANRDACLDTVEAAFPYPVFVKPANLGSSIGISRAKDRKSLEDAIDVAASFDRRILVEKGVEKPKEVNCGVLGYGAECEASPLEMPVSWDEFLSFPDKYGRGGKRSQGMQSLARQIPAPISEEKTRIIQNMAMDAFRALDSKGVARVDFILDEKEDKIYIGEINTIPGSLAFYLFEYGGLKFESLIDRMIRYAYQARAERRESVFTYTSDILKNKSYGAKKLHK